MASQQPTWTDAEDTLLLQLKCSNQNSTWDVIALNLNLPSANRRTGKSCKDRYIWLETKNIETEELERFRTAYARRKESIWSWAFTTTYQGPSAPRGLDWPWGRMGKKECDFFMEYNALAKAYVNWKKENRMWREIAAEVNVSERLAERMFWALEEEERMPGVFRRLPRATTF